MKLSSVEGINYFQIARITEKDLTKLIVNETPFDLEITSKANRTEPSQTVKSKSKLSYCQNYPESSGSELKFRFYDENTKAAFFVDFMKITKKPLLFDFDQNSEFLLEATIKFVGMNKIIKVNLVPKQSYNRRELKNGSDSLLIMLEFQILAVSFLRVESKNQREELLFLALKKFFGKVQIDHNFGLMTSEGNIQAIQVDNPSVLSSNTPVIMRNIVGKSTSDSSKQEAFFHWKLALENPFLSSHHYIEELKFGLSNLQIMVEEEYLDRLKEYFYLLSLKARPHDNLPKGFDSLGAFLRLKYYGEEVAVKVDRGLDCSKFFWQHHFLDNSNNLIYINELFFPTVQIYLSYFQDSASTVDKEFEMVSLLGVAVGGFEEAFININPLLIESIYQSMDVLSTEIMSYYQSQLAKAAYNIIGSLNIIGNPAQIAREFSGGIDSLVDKPNGKGGGISSGKNYAKGAVAGIFSGVNNATGSIAGVFTLMTGDKKFMTDRRNRKRKKAKNLFEGLKLGAESFASGVTEGIVGIVKQPILGAQNKGVGGFFTGIAKGVSGVVTKPVSGVFDTISKTSEVS